MNAVRTQRGKRDAASVSRYDVRVVRKFHNTRPAQIDIRILDHDDSVDDEGLA
jgi:hypothetical protein